MSHQGPYLPSFPGIPNPDSGGEWVCIGWYVHDPDLDYMPNGESNQCAATTHRGSRCRNLVFYSQEYIPEDDTAWMRPGAYAVMIARLCHTHRPP